MGKCVFVTIGGKEYPMAFSLGAVKRMGEKFGGFKKMESLTTDKMDDLKKLDAIFDILEITIAQGCAYKNVFEKDLPKNENSVIEDGKYIPITRAEMEIAVSPDEVEGIAEKIQECFSQGSKKTVDLKIDKKNA